MAASKPQSPNLGKSQALNIAQSTVNRLATIVPTLTTELSPVTVYQPGGVVGGQLEATPGIPAVVGSTFGVWVAPDLNGDGSDYYVQVECFGAGGGGGGGNNVSGGGGGGGGEYACENQYPVTPGQSYAYLVGLQGSGGYNNSTQVTPGSAGTPGGTTIFDLAGLGLAGGVVANGGQGGDFGSAGVGGLGGTGSDNAIHFNGGNGGTNNSAFGSDNPIALSQISGMFVGNTLSPDILQCWYVMNDANFQSSTRNDNSGNGNTGRWTNFTGNFSTTGNTPGKVPVGTLAAPGQVPAYTEPAGVYGPNQTQYEWTSQFVCKSSSAPAARFSGGKFAFSGTKLTVSCWVQAPSQATWGNPANGSIAVIATNSTNITGNSLKGYALFANQAGNAANPSWNLAWAVGNGTTRYLVRDSSFAATPGAWYYIVGTFNSGLLTLYVNGVSVGTTTASYTSVPGGAYGQTLGMDPSIKYGWFFGIISNVWWAQDCATSTLVSQAFGLTPATGGCGGGSSGSPGGVGGNGFAGSGAIGAIGGTAPSQPSNLVNTTSPGSNGYSGGNAAANGSTAFPGPGFYGAGGGGAGDMTSNPTLTVLSIPFSSAATYAGPDATSNPGTPYNTNQQTNPNTGLTSVLFSGGAASDSSSGSKNSMMLLPKGLSTLLGSGAYTICNVFLTFTNALPNNTIESILEIGYSNDTVLPQTYEGASLVNYIGAVPIPIGSETITYDLTQSGIATQLANGTCTAFILGPGDNPTWDAYSAPTGPQYYSSIYGPGAADMSANELYPFLEIVLQKTHTVQHGSPGGGGGGIIITAIDNSFTPVATVQPYATTDEDGNQFAQGFTGPTQNWNQLTLTAGEFEPEVWHALGFSNAPSGATGYYRIKRLAESNFVMVEIEIEGFTAGSTGDYSVGSLPSAAYYPQNVRHFPAFCTVNGSATIAQYFANLPRLYIPTSGQTQLFIPQNATGFSCNAVYAID